MKRYSANLVGVLYQSIIDRKKGLLILCQGLQSLYYNRDKIRDLLILYIINAVYSSYLPTPVKVVWVILASYYRRAFDDASRKNQTA
jgi:hypothetical protein